MTSVTLETSCLSPGPLQRKFANTRARPLVSQDGTQRSRMEFSYLWNLEPQYSGCSVL